MKIWETYNHQRQFPISDMEKFVGLCVQEARFCNRMIIRSKKSKHSSLMRLIEYKAERDRNMERARRWRSRIKDTEERVLDKLSDDNS